MKNFKTLTDVVDHLYDGLTPKDLKSIRKAVKVANPFFGMQLRNGFNLWWSPEGRDKLKGSGVDYPQTIPDIVEWFHSKGLYHADDMSAAIIEAFLAKVLGADYDIQTTVDRVNKHWEKAGITNTKEKFASWS